MKTALLMSVALVLIAAAAEPITVEDVGTVQNEPEMLVLDALVSWEVPTEAVNALQPDN